MSLNTISVCGLGLILLVVLTIISLSSTMALKNNSLVIRYGDTRYLYNVTSEETIALGEDEALTEGSVPWDMLQSLTA